MSEQTTGTWDRIQTLAALVRDAEATQEQRDEYFALLADRYDPTGEHNLRNDHGPEAMRRFKADHPLTPAPAVEAPAVDLYRPGYFQEYMTAADYAEIFATAAEIIKARGYYAYEAQGYADEPGLSLTGALKAAALEHSQAHDPHAEANQHHRTANDIAEDAETRLGGLLYVFGAMTQRTGIQDLSDQLTGWALGYYAGSNSDKRPGKAEALALLEQAARFFGGLADDTAPVTEAPASLASCGHPRNADGECDCSSWPERAPAAHQPPLPF